MSAATFTYMPYAVAHALRAAGLNIAATTNAFLERVGDSLTHSIAYSEREREEAYLSESVDCYDLERRMRELDHARNHTNTVFWTS